MKQYTDNITNIPIKCDYGGIEAEKNYRAISGN